MRIDLIAAGAAALLLALVAPLPAQTAGDTVVVYRREVFAYPAAGRPDPFRSLLNSEEFGLRLEDLVLRGIVYNQDPRQSVAVLSQTGSDRRIRVRVGQRIGGLRIVAIHPRRVDVVVDDFGVARRESLELKRETETGSGA